MQKVLYMAAAFLALPYCVTLSACPPSCHSVTVIECKLRLVDVTLTLVLAPGLAQKLVDFDRRPPSRLGVIDLPRLTRAT